MFKVLLALHIVFAIFVIGPLAHAAKTAGRGVRKGDGAATAEAARLLRIYSIVSVLVVLLGFGLMSMKEDGEKVAEFGDTWIWLSLVLWLAAVGVIHAVMVPMLNKITASIQSEESVVGQTLRVATAGGVVGTLFVVIVFLMVYKPGS
jgi:uncharacterized membrane protein